VDEPINVVNGECNFVRLVGTWQVTYREDQDNALALVR